MALEQAVVNPRGLVRDDLHLLEVFAQARSVDLALLVREVSLGDQQQRVSLRQRRDRLGAAVDQLHFVVDHGAAHVDDGPDVALVHPAAGHLDGGLDHGKGKAADAEAEGGQVAHLFVVQRVQDFLAAGAVRGQ